MWFIDHPETLIAILGWLGSALGLWLHLTKQRNALEMTVTELKKDVEGHLEDCGARNIEAQRKRAEYEAFKAKTEERVDNVKQILERMERKVDDILSGVYGVPRSHGTRRNTDEVG